MKRKKSEKLFNSIGNIDEKYIEEAMPSGKKSGIKKTLLRYATIAACLALTVGLCAYLFVPLQPYDSNISAYRDSDYYPLIEGIENYAMLLKNETNYKNNFEKITADIDFNFGLKGDAMAPGDGYWDEDFASAPADTENGFTGSDGNGEYQETTDNQVTGVIEADLMKRTDKYIFRLGCKDKDTYYSDKYPALYLNIYEIAAEDTRCVCSYEVPKLSGENILKSYEMYLADDGSSITLIKNYIRTDGRSRLGVMKIDLKNIESPYSVASFSIDGSYNTSRLMDGKLLLVSEHYFNIDNVDYSDPSTFVPTLDRGNGDEPLTINDIIYPSEITSARYSVVTLLDSSDLTVLGANGLLNFTNTLYISENRAYLTREYLVKSDEKKDEKNDEVNISDVMTEIAVLSIGDSLSHERNISVCGSITDRFCLDEYEGNLRVVTTIVDSIEKVKYGYSYTQNISASLYVISLSDGSLVSSVERFAPDGDEVSSARFDGDELYVCTAVVLSFTDPVYYFDLSDLSSITYKDTGYIEGFSSSLIDFGDGFLLGIGRLNWMRNKVEVWEESVSGVDSVSSFVFDGDYSSEYKAYFIDRQHRMFGFMTSYYYDEESGESFSNSFLLFQFDGYELTLIKIIPVESYVSDTRTVLIDGHLYITTPHNVEVIEIYQSEN